MFVVHSVVFLISITYVVRTFITWLRIKKCVKPIKYALQCDLTVSCNLHYKLHMNVLYASKKPVRTWAKSAVAAVYINSRITLRMPTHVDRMVLAQPSVHKERKLGARYSNSRGMGLL